MTPREPADVLMFRANHQDHELTKRISASARRTRHIRRVYKCAYYPVRDVSRGLSVDGYLRVDSLVMLAEAREYTLSRQREEEAWDPGS